MTPELQLQLDEIYAKAIDHRTSDNYASALRRKARRLCLTSGEPREYWPAWTEEGAPWQQPADRNDPVEYPPELSPAVIAELERFRANNTPAEARSLCRSLGIAPPAWAVR